MQAAPDHQRAAIVVSHKLAKALAGPWRTKVLLEVTLRPMSPSQFVKEIGGDSSHIALCFRQLEEWGFVELVEERSGGHRRGGVEHVYRAIKRAFIDDEIAERLPRPIREDISVNILSAYFRQIAKAVEAGTADLGRDGRLHHWAIRIDRAGWRRLMRRLAEALSWYPNLVLETAERTAASSEEPSLITVGIAGFRSASSRSPSPEIEPRLLGLEEQDEPLSGAILSNAMARALSSPWRARVLAEVSVRPMSPSEFVEDFGGDLSHIARCFRQLAKAGFLEMVRRQPGGRGAGPAAVRHVYQCVRPPHIPAVAQRSVPLCLGDEVSTDIVNRYCCQFTDAIEAGTFDSDTDRHLSWDMIYLDRQARAAFVARLRDIAAWLPELEAEAERRLAASGEEPITTTVALAAFRSPSPPRMAS